MDLWASCGGVLYTRAPAPHRAHRGVCRPCPLEPRSALRSARVGGRHMGASWGSSRSRLPCIARGLRVARGAGEAAGAAAPVASGSSALVDFPALRAAVRASSTQGGGSGLVEPRELAADSLQQLRDVRFSRNLAFGGVGGGEHRHAEVSRRGGRGQPARLRRRQPEGSSGRPLRARPMVPGGFHPGYLSRTGQRI